MPNNGVHDRLANSPNLTLAVQPTPPPALSRLDPFALRRSLTSNLAMLPTLSLSHRP